MRNAIGSTVREIVATALREKEGGIDAEVLSSPDMNVLRQIANGRCLLPAARISDYASILGIDGAELLQTALEEYHPGLLTQVQALLYGAPLSVSERKILSGFRSMKIPDDRTVCVVDGSSIAAVITQEA